MIFKRIRQNISSIPRRRIFLNRPLFIPVDVPRCQSDSLIAFYLSGNGDNWNDNTGWLTDPVVGNWAGITVSGGHVTGFSFRKDNSYSGDIKHLSALSYLETLQTDNTQIYGKALSIKGLTNLAVCRMYSDMVDGDVSLIQYLPKLSGTAIHLGFAFAYKSSLNNKYTQGSIPQLTRNIILVSLGLSQTEIDNFLVDMDNSGSTDCPIDVSRNSVPSQTGLDAIASLDGKGCTITYDIV